MAKKNTKKEPTITDVYEVLTDFVGFTKNQFEKVEEKLNKHDRMFGLMNDQLTRIDKEVKDIKTTVRHIEQDVLTVKEDVDAIAKTVSRDSLTLKSQGRRLVNLERSRF
jgi:archaellum component FlaC